MKWLSATLPLTIWMITAWSLGSQESAENREREQQHKHSNKISILTQSPKIIEGFHKWGYPHSWMVYFREISQKLMMTGCTPISGNLQLRFTTSGKQEIPQKLVERLKHPTVPMFLTLKWRPNTATNAAPEYCNQDDDQWPPGDRWTQRAPRWSYLPGDSRSPFFISQTHSNIFQLILSLCFNFSSKSKAKRFHWYTLDWFIIIFPVFPYVSKLFNDMSIYISTYYSMCFHFVSIVSIYFPHVIFQTSRPPPDFRLPRSQAPRRAGLAGLRREGKLLRLRSGDGHLAMRPSAPTRRGRWTGRKLGWMDDWKRLDCWLMIDDWWLMIADWWLLIDDWKLLLMDGWMDDWLKLSSDWLQVESLVDFHGFPLGCHRDANSSSGSRTTGHSGQHSIRPGDEALRDPGGSGPTESHRKLVGMFWANLETWCFGPLWKTSENDSVQHQWHQAAHGNLGVSPYWRIRVLDDKHGIWNTVDKIQRTIHAVYPPIIH